MCIRDSVNLADCPIEIEQDDVFRLAEMGRAARFGRIGREGIAREIGGGEPEQGARAGMEHVAARDSVAEAFAGSEDSQHHVDSLRRRVCINRFG